MRGLSQRTHCQPIHCLNRTWPIGQAGLVRNNAAETNKTLIFDLCNQSQNWTSHVTAAVHALIFFGRKTNQVRNEFAFQCADGTVVSNTVGTASFCLLGNMFSDQ